MSQEMSKTGFLKTFVKIKIVTERNFYGLVMKNNRLNL